MAENNQQGNENRSDGLACIFHGQWNRRIVPEKSLSDLTKSVDVDPMPGGNNKISAECLFLRQAKWDTETSYVQKYFEQVEHQTLIISTEVSSEARKFVQDRVIFF